MSNSENLELQAEQKVLSYLINNPASIFDIDNTILTSFSFNHIRTKIVYNAIVKIAEKDKNLNDNTPIDETILLSYISNNHSSFWKDREDHFKTLIDTIKNINISKQECFKFAKIILTNAIKRESQKKLEQVGKKIETIDSAKEVLGVIEREIFDLTSRPIGGKDIEVLGHNYNNFLSQRELAAKEGRLTIGIQSPFEKYNEAIGGGFRPGTISVLAARSKFGKSWVACRVADYAARKNIPVLYLDTELENNYQADRRCSQSAQVPMYVLETASYVNSKEQLDRVNNAIEDFKKYPVYYVDIKGWSLDMQISVIRRFFAKYVGKNNRGEYNDALVILDYLKLMRAGEKGADKEWEALGYRMTVLHDLMGTYNQPMFMLVQQNRDGLEKENESTVSGSDRIIYLCDNFTIFSPLDEAQVAEAQLEADESPYAEDGSYIKVPNSKLRVVVCRHGPGTKGSYISIYADIHDPRKSHKEVCGILEEGSKRIG